VSGTPTVKLDGDHEVVGGMTNGTMYPPYRAYFDTHKSVPSVLDFGLACTFDSTSREGRLEIRIRNTSGSAVSGQLQVALCENHLYYVWYGLDSVHHVERNMLPNASGEAITVPANDSITKTRDYAVDPAWVARNCELIVFVQNNSSKAMYQGARIGVYQVPALEYRGYQSAFPEPGGDADLVIGLRNLGSGDASTVTGTLSTTDPYVTVTTPNADFGGVEVGQDVYSQTPFAIHVDAGCPNDHLATMDLAVAGEGGYATSLSFPMNITTERGFSDDMEGGVNGWTHSGTRDNWHQTAHRSQSPSNSWYCGVEGSWAYTDENDARLVTPWFTSGDSAQLSFDHWYNLEPNYDYAMPEINNGSPFWWPLATYTGASSNWQHATFPLASWSGQTVRLRFRFISDSNTTAEGWYVDNFLCEPFQTGVAEPAPGAEIRSPKLEVRSPALHTAAVAYALPAGQHARLSVFDVNGRRTTTLSDKLTGSGRLAWNLTDANGRKVEAGTYFCRLVSEAGSTTAKVIVTK
jgi:hypothetical protein